MARVLLIKSTAGNAACSQATPPLGLMHLASTLRQNRGHETGILDLRFMEENPHTILDRISSFAPDVVGISSFSLEAAAMHSLTAAIRSLPGVRAVVTGGPYATASPRQALADPAIDAAVIGEGEASFPELLDTLLAKSRKGLVQVRGIAYRSRGKVILTPPRPQIQDVDALPFPAWDLVDIGAYEGSERFSNIRKNRYMPVFTSRSCPYQCIYCHAIFGKGFRPRSPENVLEEIEQLVHRHGIREIEIIDDVFNLDAARAEAILDMIVQRGLKIKIAFPNGLRSDLLTERLLQKMKAAGTHFLGIAIETGSRRIQQLIRKNLDLEKARHSIDMAADLGITTVGFFMVGFPSETREELQATMDFACRSRLNFATFFTVTPFQGTPLWDLCREQANLQTEQGAQDYHRNDHNLSLLDDKEFARIKGQGYRRFYSKFISRIILPKAHRDVSLGQMARLGALRVL